MMLRITENQSKPKGNQLKKYRLKKKILFQLYNDEIGSASAISKRLGVSLPTTLLLLNELSEEGYVREKGTGTPRIFFRKVK